MQAANEQGQGRAKQHKEAREGAAVHWVTQFTLFPYPVQFVVTGLRICRVCEYSPRALAADGPSGASGEGIGGCDTLIFAALTVL
jgi:hypothetical protein